MYMRQMGLGSRVSLASVYGEIGEGQMNCCARRHRKKHPRQKWDLLLPQLPILKTGFQPSPYPFYFNQLPQISIILHPAPLHGFTVHFIDTTLPPILSAVVIPTRVGYSSHCL